MSDVLRSLIAQDEAVQRRQQAWKDNPPAAGYWRHEGYYGCGEINHKSTDTCRCGLTILRTSMTDSN